MQFVEAMKSFLGHLEGTQKSANTISNYRSDLHTLQEFLNTGLGTKPVELADLTRDDLERYPAYLKAKGFRTNTRRRKLLTLRRLLRYLTLRKKFALDISDRLPAPQKLERVPVVVPYEALLASIRALKPTNELALRNQLLFWTLLESGGLVSEVAKLRYEDVRPEGTLRFEGKAAREVPVSAELIQALTFGPASTQMTPWIFQGYGKSGALGGAISPRGIELLVERDRARLGFESLTPRAFRQAAVLRWHQLGLTKDEIRRRLGLKTEYAFRVFDPLFKETVVASAAEPSDPQS